MNRKKTPDLSSLIEVLNYFHPLSTPVEAFLRDHLTLLRCGRSTLLLNEGEVCRHLYFIRKGVLRGFIRSGTKDVTTWINAENEIVTSIAGLNAQKPSLENIQSIERCELLVMTFESLEELYLLHPEFNITIRKLLQLYYHDAESRAFISRLTGTEQKYEHFLKRYAHLANRVPIKYIASFLGVTLETMSRVRKRITQ